MIAKLGTILLVIQNAAFIFTPPEPVEQKIAYCESYQKSACDKPNKKDCFKQQECGPNTPDSHNHCFTLWERDAVTGVLEMQMKGCFFNNKNCYKGPHCSENKMGGKPNNLYYCCCNGHMCNQNITYENVLFEKPKVSSIEHTKIDFFSIEGQLEVFLPMVAAIFFFLMLFILIAYLFKQRRNSGKLSIAKAEVGTVNLTPEIPVPATFPQLKYENEMSQQLDAELSNPALTSTVLIEKQASGRFGTIWTARRQTGETVAVKVFQRREKQSWKTELKIFSLPLMNQEDLLQYFGACRVGDNLGVEYWLLTDYCERGSLYDHLKNNTVTRAELRSITLSIARGLKHLHEAQRDPISGNMKPVVAHRDFKSKNILLKGVNPVRVCIADFNLSLAIQDCVLPANQRSRVGTLRYMAPEVLDGAISFRKDAVLAIDMYACGLVLWEVMSRCVIDENPVDDYRVPYEAEVGLMAGLAEIYECVVEKGLRPKIKESWRQDSDLAVLCSVIEECWDVDSDSRISSATAMERISFFDKTPKTTS